MDTGLVAVVHSIRGRGTLILHSHQSGTTALPNAGTSHRPGRPSFASRPAVLPHIHFNISSNPQFHSVPRSAPDTVVPSTGTLTVRTLPQLTL